MTILNPRQKKIFKSLNWLFSAYVYRFAIGFFTLALVTRYLGPEQYGIYSYSLSAYAILESLLYLVNQDVVKKEYIEEKFEFWTLKSILIFQICYVVLLFIGAQSILWFSDIEDQQAKVLISIFLFSILFRPLDQITHYFSSREENDYIAKVEIVSVTIFNGLRALFVFLRLQLSSFAWAYVLNKFVYAFFTSLTFLRTSGKDVFKSKLSKPYMLKVLKLSFPLFLASTSSILFTKVDQIMIGKLLSNKDVGLYSVVVKLSESWIFVAAIFSQSIYPRLVSSYKESVETFEIKVQKAFTVLGYIAIGIIFGTLVFGDEVINLVFSNKYSDSIPLLRTHIFYIFLVFWVHINNFYDIINGLTRITLIKTVVASLFNIFANYFLIKKFGLIGASYATISSYFILVIGLNLFFKETRKLIVIQFKSFIFWKHKWIY